MLIWVILGRISVLVGENWRSEDRCDRTGRAAGLVGDANTGSHSVRVLPP